MDRESSLTSHSSIRIDHEIPSTVPSRAPTPEPAAEGNIDEKAALSSILQSAKKATAPPPEFDMGAFGF